MFNTLNIKQSWSTDIIFSQMPKSVGGMRNKINNFSLEMTKLQQIKRASEIVLSTPHYYTDITGYAANNYVA